MVRHLTLASIAGLFVGWICGWTPLSVSRVRAQGAQPSSEPTAEPDASSPDAREDDSATSSGTETGGSTSSPPDDLPETPEARLREAERAFQSANFQRLPPLLEPLAAPQPPFESMERRIRTRELLGVGYYFEAQQSTDPERRDALLESARTQFWKVLQKRPDYSLDPLIFPASVVELFESVREQHAEQLTDIRRRRSTPGDSSQAAGETLYIERRVEERSFALTLFPFGVGQFQNGSPLKGSLFASGQLAALGLHATGFVAIENLRNAQGRFDVGPDRSGGAFVRARRWRRVQYAALGLFGGLYIWSVIDAILEFERRRVRIRTLDRPPPELGSETEGATGHSPSIRIGWGTLQVRW